MTTLSSALAVLGSVGRSLGTSPWLAITQDRVDKFADATGDHQWIHVDPVRAEAESPFGGPIAHGFLSLSLIPHLAGQTYSFPGAKLAVNYGSDRVRFINPVPVGARIRLESTVATAAELPGGAVQMTVTATIEIEGTDKPALVAETITRVYF